MVYHVSSRPDMDAAIPPEAGDVIRSFIAPHPEVAGRLADCVVIVMVGLPTVARRAQP